VAVLLEATRTVPIVFTVVVDPVGAGFIEKLSQPGGNVTGFMMFDYSLAGKWPELLKQAAPNVTQAAVLRDPTISVGIGQFAVIQAVAPALGLEVTAINISDQKELQRAAAAFAREPNGGLIVTAAPSTQVHRDLIVALAARHNLPAVYFRPASAAQNLSPMAPILRTNLGKRRGISIAFSGARNRPACSCRHQTNTSW
jgi:putative ABC transport system substrate-binding protein